MPLQESLSMRNVNQYETGFRLDMIKCELMKPKIGQIVFDSRPKRDYPRQMALEVGDEILSNSTLYCQTVNSCVLERLEEEVVPCAGTRADSGTVLYVHAVKVLTPNSCKKGKLLSDTIGQLDSEMICKWSCTALAKVVILESLGNIEFIK
ncbi:hypothetical protein H5410_025412 [Solanum commersonii]|uniref:Uncharacterized protein n=1 Tax=Solanum commersonii TaxID=4109 RepID=A0A9J5YVU2_SOLCO|nr:hypothetical protein H5410_025412 [Solanum commersonii]